MALLIAASAPPAAAQVPAGGVMGFAASEVAVTGGFGGLAVDVRRVEPCGYGNCDAGIWAVQVGAAVPVVRREAVRVSLRAGTSTTIAGPAVEPDGHPTVGARPARRGAGVPGRGGPRAGVHALARRAVRRLVRD